MWILRVGSTYDVITMYCVPLQTLMEVLVCSQVLGGTPVGT